MGSPMSFWAVEVKPGVSQKVQPDENKIIHISQVALGEAKKDKGSDNVPVFVKCGDQKIVLGSLSSEKFPQVACDLVFDHEFELSHNFKNTSVYFSGYAVVQGESDGDVDSDDFESLPSDSDSEEELPLAIAENGKPKSKLVEETKPANATKSQKPKVKVVEPSKDKKPVEDVSEDADSDDELDDSGSEDDESDDEEMNDVGTDSDSDSDDEDDDDEDDDDDDEDEEETPKKPESSGKKRPNDSATKTPVPAKKAKAVTPQKTDGKKGGHTATPHPSKQVAKTSGKSEKKPQTPKSGGEVVCNSCSKTFKSDGALQAHSKAKHSASK